jgi:hypothetical protein
MTRFSAVFAIVSLCCTNIAFGEVPVANFQYTGSGRYTDPGAPTFEPFISFGDPAVMPALGFLGNVSMSLLDVANGTTPDLVGDFANFEALSTNGVDDNLYFGFLVSPGVGSTQSLTESALLSAAFSTAPGVGAPDYAGYDLTRVEVFATSYQGGADGAFDVTIEYTVYAEQLIPEPTTIGMAALSLIGLMGYGNRRHRQ